LCPFSEWYVRVLLWVLRPRPSPFQGGFSRSSGVSL
jgi:hypothetical protein